jgi:hypothetical protein
MLGSKISDLLYFTMLGVYQLTNRVVGEVQC